MASTIKQRYKSNQVVVNTKSNFKSHLVKCQKILDDIKYEELVLKAMGRATLRAQHLATQLNHNNFNTFELKEKTYSVDILEDKSRKPLRGYQRDQFDPDSLDETKKVTSVPAIEVIVRKNKLELDRIRKATEKFEFKRH